MGEIDKAVMDPMLIADAEPIRAILLDTTGEERWLREIGAPACLRIAPRVLEPAHRWLKSALHSESMRNASAAWLARHLPFDTKTLLALPTSLRPAALSRLERDCQSEEAVADLCASVLGWKSIDSTEFARWKAFAIIAPPSLLPAVIVDAQSSIEAAIRLASDFALGVPLALRCDTATWETWLANASWDRDATRWRLAQTYGAPADIAPPSTSLTPVWLRTNAPALLPAYEKASASITACEKSRKSAPSINAHGECGARSAVEALLFDALQTRPMTKGRFRVNEKLDFTFGTRAAEADLADAAARLAIEIDGHYHFEDLDAYRRDRSKDALYQEHGWFIIRFHADDVARELGAVISAIERALARRDASRPQA